MRPITALYWDFLTRNGEVLRSVDRLAMPLAASRKRTPEQRAHAAEVRSRVLESLRRGAVIPANVARESG